MLSEMPTSPIDGVVSRVFHDTKLNLRVFVLGAIRRKVELLSDVGDREYLTLVRAYVCFKTFIILRFDFLLEYSRIFFNNLILDIPETGFDVLNYPLCHHNIIWTISMLMKCIIGIYSVC